MWDPKDFDGITDLTIDADLVWIPDVTLLTAMDATESMFVEWKQTPR